MKRREEEHGSVPTCKVYWSLLGTSELADLQLEKVISHLAAGQKEPWPELGQVSVTVQACSSPRSDPGLPAQSASAAAPQGLRHLDPTRCPEEGRNPLPLFQGHEAKHKEPMCKLNGRH